MSEKKSSRTFINLLGIPSLLAIIVAGDSFYQLPIFSIFIGIVLYLGIKEIPVLIKGSNGAGKTSLLMGLLWGFYGTAGVQSWGSHNGELTNREARVEDDGEMYVRISFEHGSPRPGITLAPATVASLAKPLPDCAAISAFEVLSDLFQAVVYRRILGINSCAGQLVVQGLLFSAEHQQATNGHHQ